MGSCSSQLVLSQETTDKTHSIYKQKEKQFSSIASQKYSTPSPTKPVPVRVGNFNFLNQHAEKEWFLSCVPTLGVTAEDLLPGDILMHKDYGDTGEPLYKTLTRMAMIGKAIRVAKDKLPGFKEANIDPKALSPFSLHPYVYIGKVSAPEGFDPADSTEVPVPAVAQCSRFYPCFKGAPKADIKCAGCRRKKLSSLAGESIVVYRFKDPMARKRICAVALALTSPTACQFARQKLEWPTQRPLIKYKKWSNLAALRLAASCIHAEVWCDSDSDMQRKESVMCEKAYRIMSTLADAICSTSGECSPQEMESSITKCHHQLTLESATQLVQIGNGMGPDFDGFTCAEFASCVLYAAFPYPETQHFPTGLPTKAAMKFWKICPPNFDEFFCRFGQPDDPNALTEMFVLDNDYTKKSSGFVPANQAHIRKKSIAVLKLFAGESVNDQCTVSGCNLPHLPGKLYCEKHKDHLQDLMHATVFITRLQRKFREKVKSNPPKPMIDPFGHCQTKGISAGVSKSISVKF